jgi:hypothetical protein
MARTPALVDGDGAEQRALEVWHEDGGHFAQRDGGSDGLHEPSPAPAAFICHVLPKGQRGSTESAGAKVERGLHVRERKAHRS